MRIGSYELLDELGRGGMGVVYRARELRTGALRAVKLISGTPSPEALLRFRRESEALARAGGEGIVPVHETGVEGDRLFFVMALMGGGSLRARLRARKRLDWREAAGIVAALARALSRCHAVGLIHRDLKPDNVLFDEEGRPHLVDFGCVRDLAATPLTATGEALGTPNYMAPEQLDGQAVDARADVYGLGVILHELVAGELPFTKLASILELLVAKRAGRIPAASAIAGSPVALDRLIARALGPCATRHPTAAALADDLDALRADPDRPPARSRARSLALGALLGASALAVALVSTHRRDADPAASESAASGDAALGRLRARLDAGAVTSEELPFADVKAVAAFRPQAPELLRVAQRAIAYSAADVATLGVSAVGSATLETLRGAAALGTGDPALRDEAREHLRRGVAGGLASELVQALDEVDSYARRLGDLEPGDWEKTLVSHPVVVAAKNALPRTTAVAGRVPRRVLASALAPLEPFLRVGAFASACRQSARLLTRVGIVDPRPIFLGLVAMKALEPIKPDRLPGSIGVLFALNEPSADCIGMTVAARRERALGVERALGELPPRSILRGAGLAWALTARHDASVLDEHEPPDMFGEGDRALAALDAANGFSGADALWAALLRRDLHMLLAATIEERPDLPEKERLRLALAHVEAGAVYPRGRDENGDEVVYDVSRGEDAARWIRIALLLHEKVDREGR